MLIAAVQLSSRLFVLPGTYHVEDLDCLTYTQIIRDRQSAKLATVKDFSRIFRNLWRGQYLGCCCQLSEPIDSRTRQWFMPKLGMCITTSFCTRL